MLFVALWLGMIAALTAPTVYLIRRNPAAWRVLVGRWGLAVGIVTLAATLTDKLAR